MDFGLRVSIGFQRANNLDCRRASRRRKAFVCTRIEKLTAFVELLPANQFREDTNAWQFTISEERAIHMSRELRTRNKERVI
jgi:hypothetical protein